MRSSILVLSLLIVVALSGSCDNGCNGIEICGSDNECELPALFDASPVRLALSTILVFFGAMLAAAGGLGGGGIFVPLFILVLGASSDFAIPLSQATIFGGSIVNMWMNTPRKHPSPELKGYPLIDMNAVLMLEPMLLAGTIVGVMLNVIFPSYVIVALLIITLVYSTYRTVRKGLVVWKQESRAKVANVDTGPRSIEINPEDSPVIGESSELKKLKDKDRFPKVQIIATIIVWVLVSLSSILRGGRSSDSVVGIDHCSGEYWGVVIATFVALFILTFVIGKWLNNLYNKKTALGWAGAQGEIEWTLTNSNIYPFFSLGAGLLGGLLGIGGGMILGPLLLELGMHSRATSATSATAVFMTASSAALQYYINDRLVLDFALWFGCFGVLATYVGQTAIDFLVKKYNRSSFIIGSIAGVLGVATIMMVISGVIQVIDDINDDNLGFQSFC